MQETHIYHLEISQPTTDQAALELYRQYEMAAHYDKPGAIERLEELHRNHNAYLSGAAQTAETHAHEARGVQSRKVGNGPEVLDVALTGTTALPLEQLGLPEIPNFKTSALIVERLRGEVRSFRAIGVGTDYTGRPTVLQYFLENRVAALSPRDYSEPVWVRPGNVKLSSETAASIQHTPLTNDAERYAIGANSERPDVAIELIRFRPSKAERAAARELTPGNEERKASRKSRIARAGVAAGIAVLAAFTNVSDDHHPQRDIRTASEAVMPAGTHVDQYGIRQAEEYYDAATLARSREAYAAYLAGDKAELKRIIERNGYERDWISNDQIEAVSDANTKQELLDRFNSALGGAPVELALYDESYPANIDTSSQKQDRLGDDVNDAAKVAADVLRVLNQLSKPSLKDIHFIMAKNVRTGDVGFWDKLTLNPGPLLGGYYDSDGVTGTKGPTIVLNTSRSFGIMDIDKSVVAHEVTHGIADDQVVRASVDNAAIDWSPLENHNISLNPEGISQWYLGDDRRFWSSTGYNGMQISQSVYGRKSSAEDVAEFGAQVFTDNATLDGSPASEKKQNIIFDAEERMPGATAALLLDAPRPHRMGKAGEVLGIAKERLINRDHPVRTPINSLLLLVLAAQGYFEASSAGRALRRKLKKQ